MRRDCPACDQQFIHTPVVATGDCDGDRVHLIVCSWTCLADAIRSEDLCDREAG